MAAMQGLKVTLLLPFLATNLFSGQAQSVFDIPQCANRRLFTIGRDNQFSITCTGLQTRSYIYWSISSPLTNGTEIRLGECVSCYPNCTTTNCSIFNSRDYSITRHQSDVTTLTFVDNLEQNQGALIKCSQLNNATNAQAYCATAFLNATRRSQFNITECNNGAIEILPNQTVNLTCTGLWPLSNIYWSLTGPSTNHTEVSLGDCPSCYPTCDSTPCDVPDNRYLISRPRYDVTVVEDAHLNDSVTFKCSQLNNATTAQSSCTIHIRKAYQLPQCEDGQLDVSAEEPWTAIRCEGLRSYHNITWTLTDPDNQTTDIASCTVYSDRNNACSAASAEFVVSRTRDVSELRIVGNVREKDNNTVICVKQDGATGDSCRLRVISEEQDSPLPDKFPAAAVGGGVAAAVVVVVIVVVVVVFVKLKRRSHSSESGPQSTGLEPVIYENPVDSSESAAGGSYDSLQMSDVGLSSEYSAIGNTNTGSQPQAGQPTHYDSLQVSDIGQVSTYSVIGDNKNTSHCAGGDYEIP
ncbi:uncharacterized protein [Littorina saxatilis]|uniref:Ig-like domain-containing protein n=1 Tax=Littorina saxatilis TaxID=31220 RepID=A0AAN9BN40_9CAEN